MARCHHSHGHCGNRLPHHRQIGAKAAAAFYTAVINGELEVASLADVDWQRIQELVATCADMRLGGTDAHLDARNPDPSPAQPARPPATDLVSRSRSRTRLGRTPLLHLRHHREHADLVAADHASATGISSGGQVARVCAAAESIRRLHDVDIL
jgi:hypothetical protein